jgi:filamentous hemagglutinin
MVGFAVAAKGIAADAQFAQKTYGAMFSKGGTFAGRSVDDVAGALRSGAMKPSEVPIDFIVRDGRSIILNTRSAQALEAAGVPRSQWNAVNRTGSAAYEGRLTDQLSRNPGGPFDTVRRSGGQ